MTVGKSSQYSVMIPDHEGKVEEADRTVGCFQKGGVEGRAI